MKRFITLFSISILVVLCLLSSCTEEIPQVEPGETPQVENGETPQVDTEDIPVVETDFKYNVNSRGITITGYKESLSDGKLVLPNEIGGKPVVEIAENAFFGRDDLVAAVIPANVDTIGSAAFANCASLVSLDVDEDNKTFFADGNCIITIEDEELVVGCKNSVINEGKVKIIGMRAFGYIPGLTEVIIPEGVTDVNGWAFLGCRDLKKVSFPSTLKTIGHNIFSMCASLEELEVAEGNKTFYSKGNCIIEREGKKLVAGCKNSVIPADGEVLEITNGAFQNHREIIEMVIPEGVEILGTNAFTGCNIKHVYLPKTMRIVDGQAIGWNRGMETITVAEGNPYLRSAGNCLIDKDGTVLQGTKLSVIPDDGSIKKIGWCAFMSLKIESVEIPEGVVEIEDAAFMGSDLKECTLPSTLKILGSSAFEGCVYQPDLPEDYYWTFENIGDEVSINRYQGYKRNLVIPSEHDGKPVTSILGGAFSECRSIEKVTIPASIKMIGEAAFNLTSKLNEIVVDPANKNYKIVSGCLISNDGVVITGLPGCEIPADAKRIGVGAFKAVEMKSTELRLPSTLESIGRYAFDANYDLKLIEIPESVTNVEYAAFYRCPNLSLKINNTEEFVKANWDENWNYEFTGNVEYNK